jgi:hypothetical protein
MENLVKETGTTALSITNRTQEMENWISFREGMVEEIYISFKENTKSKRIVTQKIWEI